MTRKTLWMVVMMLLVAATTASAQFWLWGRTAVVASGALLLQDGTFSDRFQVLYVADRENPRTCVMVIRDAVTAHFETTFVDPGSCPR